MKWFRLWDDVLDDPKVQQLPPALFKHWINLLCLANKNDPRGTLPAVPDIAFRLRLSVEKTREILGKLHDAGLIEANDVTLHPHNWNERQRASDDVAQRVRKHRSNVTDPLPETPRKLSRATDTDTEKETDTEREKETPLPPVGGAPAAPSPSEPYRLFQAFCEETGADEAAATKAERSKQLGIAKHLLADGVSEADVRGCIRYLRSQPWRTSLIDLGTVRAEVGKWRMAGRPKREALPMPNGRASPRAPTRDESAARRLNRALELAGGAPLLGDAIT